MLGIARTYGRLRRIYQIARVLVRHGLGHVLTVLRLSESVPGLASVIRKTRAEAQSLELTPAQRLAEAFQELGPTYIKLGQLLATRPDLIPPEFVEAFERLQDQVDPLPAAAIREVIEDRVGRPVDEIFSRFDDRAVASGSIGQVHYARLRDGTEVVVKVKRPDTDRRIRDDLDLLAELAKLGEQYMPELRVLRPRVIIDEFGRMTERELDFVGEASYTEKFRQLYEDDPAVVAPRVYWDFVTRDTLVVERIQGTRLSRMEEIDAAGIDRVKLAETLGRIFMRQFFVTGFFHADPHPGNIFIHTAERVALIDFGQMGHLSDELRRKLAMTLLALSEGDVDLIVDIYAEIGVFSEQTNLREFRNELATLIDRYYGVPIDRLDVGEAFQEALNVARYNGILLPREFVLLGKSFVTISSVIRNLDPRFRADEVVRPFTKEIFGDLLSPRALLKGLGIFGYRLSSVLRRLPEDVRDLMDKARAGKFRIIFHHEGLDDLEMELERVSKRLTITLLVVGLVIGSSIVLASGQQVGNLPLPFTDYTVPISSIVATGGFTGAIVMGLYILWSIVRGRKF